jgi:hypothetical protein
MTCVNIGANAFCILINILDEIMGHNWDLWPIMAYANATGKVDL